MRWLETRRRRWTAAAILVGIVAVAILLNLPKGPSEAERWMEARRAEGERFTLAELGWDSRPAFASPVMEVIESEQGKLSGFFAPPGPSEAIFPEPQPGQGLVLWKEAHMNSVRHLQASWELMEDQLRDVEPALAKVRSVLRTVVRDPGGSYLDRTRPINFVALRNTSQLLADAVVLDLHGDRPDRALTNLMSLIRISRQHEQHYWLVTQMIRVAITRMAVETTWQALQWPGWTDAQLEAIQSELAQCSLVKPLVHALETERALGLSYYDVLKKEGSAGIARQYMGAPTPGVRGLLEGVHSKLWQRFWSDEDLLFFLQYHQTNLVPMRALVRGEAWAPLLQSLNAAPDPGLALSRTFLGVRYPWALLSAIAIPNFRRALDHAVQAETQRRMALIAIALERYRRQHGTWPPDLESLVPNCIEELPLDPYSAQPFLYREQPSGPPRLYSVGANGRDDGGSAAPDRETVGPETSSHELDLVWPSAETVVP